MTLGRDSQIHRKRRVCLHFALMEITIGEEIASTFVVQSKLYEAPIRAATQNQVVLQIP
jgi:hypothetical protein